MHRILIIDDNEAIHSDFRKILAPERASSGALDRAKTALFGGDALRGGAGRPVHDVTCASQGEAGLACVEGAVAEGRPFAVAFVDMRMPPGWDGLQTIERLWEADANLQVVICSAYSDHSWEEVTARLGLTDRLLILKKPFDPIEVSQLAAALTEKWSLQGRAALKMDELERLVRQRTRELSHAATHDRLTALPNRSMVMEHVGESIERCRFEGLDFALYFLDFDRFKVVNDSLGHDAGDELLREIARRLTASLGCEEVAGACVDSMAARLGGDEFVVFLNGMRSPEAAGPIAERLLSDLAEPYTLKGYRLCSTASVGITTSVLSKGDVDEVLRHADIAMYHAKAAGKARSVFFDRTMHEQLMARLELERELGGVTERDELVVHYQPIVHVSSGKLRGFEALVRWNHPERGLVQPDEFISVAEDTGAIVPIGVWVLNEACRQMGVWQRAYPELENLVMSVNVSARQLVSDALVGQVKSAAMAGGIEVSSLALEITESAVMEDTDHVKSLMMRLREIGAHLHMDDFGKGFTSLSYLHRLPLTGLKIDREFIKRIGERRELAAVVHAIVGLAKNLGIGVVAEGVETPEHMAMLQALDCDYGQGFCIGRPCPAGEAERFLASNGTEHGRLVA